MAYKKYDESVIGSFRLNARGDFLNVTELEAGDDLRVDIRQMYTGDDDELHFTSKGVRMPREVMVDMVKVLIGSMYEEELEQVREKMEEAFKSLEDTED